MRSFALPLLFCLVLPQSSPAGKYNKKLDIGDAAPSWSDLPGVDGKRHALDDLAKREVVVVLFTCNSCGYATDYEDRVNAFTRRVADGEDARVAVVAINVNKVEEDRLPAMRKRAAAKEFAFDYLYDESQRTARDYGAVYTPTFFVLDRKRRIVYMGPFDDATNPERVKIRYVEAAVTAALAGRAPEIAEKPSIGCRVRYDDGRRRRGREPGTPPRPVPDSTVPRSEP